MASSAAVEEYIELTDFTPGIQSGWGSVGGIGPSGNGAAQMGKTWGCYGPPEGGLAPTPRLVSTITTSGYSSRTAPPAGYPTGLRIHDIQAVPNFLTPKTAPASTTSAWYKGAGKTNEKDLVLVTVEYFTTSGLGNAERVQQATYYNAQTGAWATNKGTMTSSVVGQTPAFGTANALMVRTASGKGTAITDPDQSATVDPNAPISQMIYVGWFGGVVYNQVCSAVMFMFGDPVLGYQRGTPPNVALEGGIITWEPYGLVPYADPDGDGDFLYWPRHGGTRGFYHQGRFCYTSTRFNGVVLPEMVLGDSQYAASWDDSLLWFHDSFAIQNFDNNHYLTTQTVSPGIFGAIASLNNNQLLMIHSTSGGVIVSGDLGTSFNPMVFQQIEPTGPNPHTPTITPAGVVYGSSNGVFGWNGSDTSQCLSPGLEGQFWTPEWALDWSNRQPWTPLGRFEYRYPFVYAPYNWVMDTRSGGWFRIHPTVAQDQASAADLGGRDLMNWSAGTDSLWASQLEQAASGVGAGEDLYLFDLDGPARSSYSWHSQPIVQGRNRITRVREVNIVAQGTGTITVTVEGVDGTSSAANFTVDSPSRPRMYTLPVNADAWDITVLIEASGSSGGEAPRLHRASLGVQARESAK